MKTIYCLLLLLCPFLIHAQMPAGALKIGDRLPAMVCSNVVNYRSSTIDLKQFRGQLLVLDFMHTGCVGCLKKLPVYDSLQRQFAGRMQLIIVTSQKPAAVQKFRLNHPLGKLLSFPVICNDTKLKALFPHEYISHLVLVGPDGLVKAITHGEYLTAASISRVIQGQPIQLPLKQDVPHFDYSRTLFVPDLQGYPIPPQQQFSSAFSAYLPELGSRKILFAADSNTQCVRTAFYNQPVTELYLGLYGKNWFPRSHIVLQVTDSSRYILDENKTPWHHWMAANSYCYESILPATVPLPQQQERINRELDFYLGINARLQAQIMPCLLLRRVTGAAPVTDTRTPLFSLATIVYELNQLYSGTPVLMDAGVDEQVKIPVLREQLRNRAALEPLLQKAGFELVPAQRRVEVLLITEPHFITNQTN